jgi:hypothetical protein
MGTGESRDVRNIVAALRRALRRRGVLVVIAGVVVALALAAVASEAGRRMITPGGPPSAADGSARAATPAGLVEFRRPQDGFALSYPSDWTRVPDADPRVALLAAKGSAYSFQVRVLELQAPIGPAQLPAAKQLTDQIVSSNKAVKLLTQQQITLGGLPGYFYFYTFTDPASGQTGAHSHFFLFKGSTMITLVFQALPAEAFRGGSATFDQIANSFQQI